MAITLNKLRTFEKSQLDKALKSKDKFMITSFLEEWGLCISNKKILPKPEYKKLWAEIYSYYDKKQLVKKILLNSAWTSRAFN